MGAMHSSSHPPSRRTVLVRVAIGAATLVAGGVLFAAAPLGAAGGNGDAMPRCSTGTAANPAIFKNLLPGEVSSVQVEIETRNTAGALIDCGVHVMMRMTS